MHQVCFTGLSTSTGLSRRLTGPESGKEKNDETLGMGDHVLFTSKDINDRSIRCFTGPGSGKFLVHFSCTFHGGRFCTCGIVTGLRIRFTWAYGVIDQRHLAIGYGSMSVCLI
jgi:hypothetical protein